MVREGLRLVFVGALFALAGCVVTGNARPPAPPAHIDPEPAPRQFRGAWVATVANIDWPSRTGLSSAEQRAEILRIVDRAAVTGLNALILQVRPAADAIYPSQLEPWSEYLSGRQGIAPDYDPLAAWIAEAHRRGIELHAWFNPYRVRHKDSQSPADPKSVAVMHPEIVKSYGGYLWMDPGEPAAAELTLDVILDVVRRYDVDGVHIDDYFYPYPEGDADFPDDPSWNRYVEGGGSLGRADWRRANVSGLIARINAGVHEVKPWVKFGISPFGLGRPDRRPPGVTGFSQYDKLYADVETWLENGWLDYLAPQLYWPVDDPKRPFPVLLDAWKRENTSGRHIWPGLYTSKLSANEVLHETLLARDGHVHFSMKALMNGGALYPGPALVPASPWLTAPPTPPPALDVLHVLTGGVAGLHVAVEAPNAALYTVWSRHGREWRLHVVPAPQGELELDPGVDEIAASAVDRVGNETARVSWSPP